LQKIKLFFTLQYNNEEYNSLIRKFYTPLVNFSDSIVNSRADAEDIVQNLFVKIWEEGNLPDDANSVANYLYVSVKNLSFNCLRYNERLKQRNLQFGLNRENENLLRKKVIEEETYRRLREAVSRLPERSAMLINLTLDGLSQEEIGEKMGISISSVKSMKAYAIRKLREMLDPKTFLCILMLVS
jgi:RNA polymerase sigma-70 factor (ECF subfamily)